METQQNKGNPETSSERWFQGQFLIASPHLEDPNFARSVVYLCDHNAEGAMGLIVNRPLPDIRFCDILQQLNITSHPGDEVLQVHFGGPVETGRGFVLHSPEYACSETMIITKSVSLTAHPRILRDLVAGKGPSKSIFTLGYAGWAPNQLEQEIMNDDWLPVPADERTLFDTLDMDKWTSLYRLLGMDPSRMPGIFGNA